MSQAELARRTRRPLKTINEIVKGKTAITPDTAIQLERVLGMPASFWLRLEANFREDLARIDERRELSQHFDWLKHFPVAELMKYGAISESPDKIEQVRELLKFFAVSSPDAWSDQVSLSGAQFRQSAVFAASPHASAAWLRWGELEAVKIECQPFDAEKFTAALTQIRGLTREAPEVFHDQVQDLCAAAGVAVVFVPELPKTRASGAAKWLTPTKAMIQLSLYGKSNDKMWFSFYHEAGHILLHRRKTAFLDQDNHPVSGLDGREEEEANRFARNFLIPPDDYDRIAHGHGNRDARIEQFAREIGIHPAIVVGRLQYDRRLPMNYGNSLKEWFVWKPS